MGMGASGKEFASVAGFLALLLGGYSPVINDSSWVFTPNQWLLFSGFWSSLLMASANTLVSRVPRFEDNEIIRGLELENFGVSPTPGFIRSTK